MLKIHIMFVLSTFKHNHKMSNGDIRMLWLIRDLNKSMLPFHESKLKLNLNVAVLGQENEQNQ